jgi:hypothetical protein
MGMSGIYGTEKYVLGRRADVESGYRGIKKGYEGFCFTLGSWLFAKRHPLGSCK